MNRSLGTAFLVLALCACAQTAPLKPLPGKALPARPLMARSTPTPDELLALPPQAVPRRSDELLTKNQPRKPDRFDLPPADGLVPVEGQSTTTAPATTGPDNAEEPR